ncbi:Calmodulin [Schistosoma japonicum]|uniref:Calmodulin n=1 Tax=Schistosoma japonicum TaxID=6182 RepID=A0A4Z2DTI2_SCHJA|nr:Calmodulin [Schistosoma japonicum]
MSFDEGQEYVNFQPGGAHKTKIIESEHSSGSQKESTKYGQWNTFYAIHMICSKFSEKIQKRLSSIFSVLARHQENIITAGDILLIMRALGDALTEAELQDLICELDTDRDGKLDFSEFCTFVVERIHKKKLNHDFEELFRILDQDSLPETKWPQRNGKDTI